LLISVSFEVVEVLLSDRHCVDDQQSVVGLDSHHLKHPPVGIRPQEHGAIVSMLSGGAGCSMTATAFRIACSLRERLMRCLVADLAHLISTPTIMADKKAGTH
jgi:hypothetical protein